MIAVVLNKPEARVDREGRFVVRSDLKIGTRGTISISRRQKCLRQAPGKPASTLVWIGNDVKNPDKPILDDRHAPSCRGALINERGV